VAGVEFQLNGRPVVVDAEGSLLDALRDRLGVRSPKDGCAPQGQCGCCTVWVDGQPRVSCVTPVARVAGRSVTTVEGLDDGLGARWADALCATGGSQCGFCTPGIVMRLAALPVPVADAAARQALLAHVCRCTGWQTILDAAGLAGAEPEVAAAEPDTARGLDAARDLDAARRRAALEGHAIQDVGPHVALGRGGFADDTAPADALVAMRNAAGEWMVAASVSEARRAAGKVQGRKSTIGLRWPIDLPDGDWVRTLQTTWVEPAYLEPDAAWCVPGGRPVGPLTNGGAFGAKHPDPDRGDVDVAAVARQLADQHGQPVRVLLAREDAVRLTPKRPPVAAGVRADGSGVIRIARTPGVVAAIAAVAPGLVVEEVDVPGPPTSAAIRAAGWAEAAVLLAALRPAGPGGPPSEPAAGAGAHPPEGGGARPWVPTDAVVAPNGARAEARLDADGTVRFRVSCGWVLDEVVLRSYCIGAAHMGLGWVRSEGIAVDADGVVHDLTIRSFGVIRAVDTPRIEVEIHADDGEPVNGSDAVFAAVAAAAWRHAGFPPAWPIAR
jgi:aerobic-type carbon monoxide dehydrogenase small subunit (CoxS/CutS family)